MSTVFDVTAVTVDGGTASTFDVSVDTVTITDVTTTPSVTISNPETIQMVTVEVPGIQGPPGLQNVFVEEVDPSEPEWGMAQLNYVWIQPI